MFKLFRKAILLALGSCSFTVMAQTPVLLDDIQVTANRYPQKQTQTGKTVTILSDSVLRANEGKTLTQLLQQHSGLQIVGANQPYGSVQSIAIRGGGFGETLILLDGVPITEPSGIGSSYDISFLPIQNIERVEILKDGQSTIYGSEAMAGVINIITKKSSPKAIAVNAGVMGGSYGTFQGDAQISGTANNTQYSIGVNSLNSQGFSSAKGVNFEKDGYNDLGFNSKLSQSLSNHLRASGFFRHQAYKTDLDEGAFTDDKDYVFESANQVWGAGLNYQKAQTGITFNYQGSRIKRDFINDSTNVPAAAFSMYSANHYNSKANFLELYSNVALSQDVKLLLGASHQFQDMDYTGFEISEWGRTDYDPVKSELAKTNQSALYAVLNGQLDNGLGLEAGLRGNRHSNYGNNFPYNINPYYLINQQVKLFASLGTSYRNPALYQLFSPYGNVDLTPEKAQTFEGGIQVFGKQAADYIRAVLFGRNYDNMIIFQSISSEPWGIYNNLDQKSKQRGFELEVNKRLGNFSAQANYTYLDGLISDDLSKDNDAIMEFLRRPKHTLNLGVAYSFNDKFNVGIQSQTWSKRNDTFFNSETFASEAVILDDFTLFHAQAAYHINDQITINLSGQNIFNKDYMEIYGFNSRGATFSGGLRVSL